MVQEEKVRVMLVQGRCLLRDLLVEKISTSTGIERCDAVSNMNEAVSLLEIMPHVLVINTSLKCSQGIALLQEFKTRFPDIAILAFSCDAEFENTHIGEMLRAGADGYISSEDDVDDLLSAIWVVKQGGSYFSESAKMKELALTRKKSAKLNLSQRESQIFVLLGTGHGTKLIADKLGLSSKTVETYMSRIRSKMDIGSAAELVYTSTSFIHASVRNGIRGTDAKLFKALFSAKG